MNNTEKCPSKGFSGQSIQGILHWLSEDGAIGHKVYVLDLQEILVGVHVFFNEMIPNYTEEYFQEFNKIEFKTADKESTVEEFKHLEGEKYIDSENKLQYQNTRVGTWDGMIVVWRALIRSDGSRGNEEKFQTPPGHQNGDNPC